ncbi:hypothetical protein DIPPA_10437, partial [Diplonema papillatum]
PQHHHEHPHAQQQQQQQHHQHQHQEMQPPPPELQPVEQQPPLPAPQPKFSAPAGIGSSWLESSGQQKYRRPGATSIPSPDDSAPEAEPPSDSTHTFDGRASYGGKAVMKAYQPPASDLVQDNSEGYGGQPVMKSAMTYHDGDTRPSMGIPPSQMASLVGVKLEYAPAQQQQGADDGSPQQPRGMIRIPQQALPSFNASMRRAANDPLPPPGADKQQHPSFPAPPAGYPPPGKPPTAVGHASLPAAAGAYKAPGARPQATAVRGKYVPPGQPTPPPPGQQQQQQQQQQRSRSQTPPTVEAGASQGSSWANVAGGGRSGSAEAEPEPAMGPPVGSYASLEMASGVNGSWADDGDDHEAYDSDSSISDTEPAEDGLPASMDLFPGFLSEDEEAKLLRWYEKTLVTSGFTRHAHHFGYSLSAVRKDCYKLEHKPANPLPDLPVDLVEAIMCVGPARP